MTILPTAPDYTDKDFEALNRRLELLLQAVFPAWTDFNRASFGNVLKESFAFAMDVVTFYQDQQARETRWGTAQLRASIIELARLIGYVLDGATAATVDVIFSIPSARGTDVVIPAGTVIKTLGSDPVLFQTLAIATVTAGNTDSAAVSAEQSESQSESFTATGEAGEEFFLSKRPFLDGSLALTIAGTPWTKVDNFLDSTPTDTHYVLLVDEEDLATVRTGDGTNGLVPTLGDAVVADYDTGGGASGNVEANTIVRVEGSFADATAVSTSVVCDNAAAASGGADRETVAQARERAPRSLRVLNRAIARTDYEDLAVQNAGVARALMLTKDEDVTVPEEGRGYLFIVPTGGGVPSGALKAEVKSDIDTDYPGSLIFDWQVNDPVYSTIDIVAYVYRTGDSTVASVEAEALTALRAFFAPLNDDGTTNTAIDFGFNYKDSAGDPDPLVSLSTIKNLINDLSGVRRLGTPDDGEGLTLGGNEDDVDLTLREFPEGGTLTLYDGDTTTIFPGHPVAI
jgi:hypothetical protein